jgi:hypothetical protein
VEKGELMDTATQNAIREAMLLEESEWLGMAEQAPTPVEKMMAHAIATAFDAAAAKYKVPDQVRAIVNDQAYDAFIRNTEAQES